jgi:AcrR family transcriptional regulator
VTTEQAIPPVVERMWGRDPASRFGPRPSLDAAAIVDAAIGIADAAGLAGVRMSSVAAHFGVATMSLYRYVGSKEELLMLMADAALPVPPPPGERPWRKYLVDWTRANRDFLITRPWLLQVTRSTPPLGPRTLNWLESGLAALAQTGLDASARITIVTTLTGYATSQAVLAQSMNGSGGEPGGLAEYSALLGRVLDPASYPELTAAVRGGAFGAAAEWIDDDDFTFGLDLLLDGIAALIERRGG